MKQVPVVHYNKISLHWNKTTRVVYLRNISFNLKLQDLRTDGSSFPDPHSSLNQICLPECYSVFFTHPNIDGWMISVWIRHSRRLTTLFLAFPLYFDPSLPKSDPLPPPPRFDPRPPSTGSRGIRGDPLLTIHSLHYVCE